MLVGCSLFYANSPEALTLQPKLFAQLSGCDVLSWADNATPHNNVFAIRLPADEGEEGELLLLAADTPADKFAWIESLNRARGKPRCPPERVAALVALQSLGGMQSVRAVIEANPIAPPREPNRRKQLGSSQGGHSQGGQPGGQGSRTVGGAPSGNVRTAASPVAEQQNVFLSFFERHMPEMFKNA